MPLVDHFHPPLSELRHWRAFHAGWAGALRDDLNQKLPERFFAEALTDAGATVEIDVGAFEQTNAASMAARNGGGTAVLTAPTWAPPSAAITIPAVFASDFEVRVFATRSGPELVAAIELVSPRNKDRPEARQAFAAKCASYLYQGINLVIVDVVTERKQNLHNELLKLMEGAEAAKLSGEPALYAVAYRPIRREREEIDMWPNQFGVGDSLPALPLWLNWETAMRVDLEATYMEAYRKMRLP